MKKTLEPTDDLCVKFTDEELVELNIKKGDKFSIHESEDGIVLKKYEELNLDLSEFPRETLEFIIVESNRLDLTISDFFEHVFKKVLINQ